MIFYFQKVSLSTYCKTVIALLREQFCLCKGLDLIKKLSNINQLNREETISVLRSQLTSIFSCELTTNFSINELYIK